MISNQAISPDNIRKEQIMEKHEAEESSHESIWDIDRNNEYSSLRLSLSGSQTLKDYLEDLMEYSSHGTDDIHAEQSDSSSDSSV